MGAPELRRSGYPGRLGALVPFLYRQVEAIAADEVVVIPFGKVWFSNLIVEVSRF